METSRRLAPCGLILAALVSFSCFSVTGAERRSAGVRQIVLDLVDAQSAGNLPLTISYFSEEADFFPHAGPPLEGVPAIAEYFRLLYREQDVRLGARIRDVQAERSLAFVIADVGGEMISSESGGRVVIQDTWLVVLRREPEGWRIHVLISRPF